MNIDFSARPGFSAYVLLLIASGIAMLIIASPTVKRQTKVGRALNAAFGLGFLGYGIYLGFMFKGGHYVIFFQAFILPIVLIIRTIRGAVAAPAARQQQLTYPPAAPAQYPGAPAQYPAAPAQYPGAQQSAYAPPVFVEDTTDYLSAPVQRQPQATPPPPPAAGHLS